MTNVNNTKGYVNAEYLSFASIALSEIKQKSYDHLDLHKNKKILDVGCGPGIDALAISRILSDKAQVFGVDHDNEMIKFANEAKEKNEQEISDRLKYFCADSSKLPFEDNYFDACRSERLLQHLKDPAITVKEMARVLKPQGKLVLLDTDWGSMFMQTKYVHTAETIKNSLCTNVIENAYSGRKLLLLARQAGFSNIDIQCFTQAIHSFSFVKQMSPFDKACDLALQGNSLTKEQLKLFIDDLHKADETDTFFAAITIVMVCGTKI